MFDDSTLKLIIQLKAIVPAYHPFYLFYKEQIGSGRLKALPPEISHLNTCRLCYLLALVELSHAILAAFSLEAGRTSNSKTAYNSTDVLKRKFISYFSLVLFRTITLVVTL